MQVINRPVMRNRVLPPKKKIRRKAFLPAGLLVACLLLVWMGQYLPYAVERLYSRGFYPLVARSLGALTSLVPVSVAELLILGAILFALFVLGYAIYLLARGRVLENAERMFFRRLPVWLLQAVCILISLFILFCGLNYYRPSYAQMSGLSVRDSSVAELAALCEELTERANLLATTTTRDENGVMIHSQSIWALCEQARQVFDGLAAENELLPDFPITPKPVLCSGAMSMAQITGVFCPITFEANVNANAPAYSTPSTICHELAHTRGFMREDEANFIGYLACVESDLPEFSYSGVMLALLHVQNQLYAADYGVFRQVWEKSSELVRQDFAHNNAYWAQYDGVVAEVSTTVNNTYLQLNNQKDGVQSYGRMVDLLLADYRQRHQLT